jgi:uncharacterized protein with HEPN domain
MRVEDILDAIAKIERYTAGMTAESFAVDDKTIDAVVRNLEIIGEAARHVPSDIAARYSAIPWGKMRGMRNFLIHDYPGADHDIVWDTVRRDLPPLAPLLRALLATEP